MLSIDGHDFVLFFGDLNYRLDYKMDEMDDVYTMIEQKMYAQLLALDQLKCQKVHGNAFDGFEEFHINFAPTYKFKMGGHKYAYDKRKNRMPAWCDRILWKTHGRSRGHAMLGHG